MEMQMRSRISLRVSTYFWTSPQRCGELLTLLKNYKGVIDEVAFFTGFTHPPVPLKVIEERAGILEKVIPEFKALGLSSGINHLATFGHLDENLENSLNEPWQRMMDIDGNISKGCYCPLDPDFRKYIAKAYILLAKAKPDFIWIDDDFRMESHGPVSHCCFCDRCIARFSEETGRTWTRGSLKKSFYSGSIDEQVCLRKKWLEHNRRILSDIASEIRSAVDTVDSSIPLGLMSAELLYGGLGFDRIWKELAGPKNIKVMWRPGGGFYTDYAPLEMLQKAHTIGRQVSWIPQEVCDIQSEIENFPYQKLKKSILVPALECAVYIGAGCTGAALNIFGISSDPFQEYVPYFEKVKEFRNFYDYEVKAFGRSSCEGIWFAMNRDYYSTLALNSDWFTASPWAGIGAVNEIAEIGLPLAYSKDGAFVSVLSGDNILSFSKEEILKILSGGVIADARALARLNETGMSEYTGFEVLYLREQDTVEVLTEDEINGDFAGWHRDCRQSFWQETAYVLKPTNNKSRVISEAIDFADKKIGPVGGIFENKLSGRIAVLGYYPWRNFHSLAKTTQMKSIFRWLSKETIPAYIQSFHKIALWCRRDAKGRTCLLLLNASLDRSEKIKVCVCGNIERMTLVRTDCHRELLKSSGRDQGYSVFEIKEMNPWEVVLLTQD